MSLPFSSKVKGEDEDLVDHQGTIINKLREREEATPDFHQLKWLPRIPYLAVGNEKENAPNHYCIQSAEYLGKGHSISPHFILKSHLNMYPVLFAAGNHEVIRQHIRGELYHVNAEMIHLLDIAFGRGEKCERVKVKVCLEDQTPDNAKYFRMLPWTDALIYVAIPKYWDEFELATRPSFMIQEPNLHNKHFYEWSPFRLRDLAIAARERKEKEMLLKSGQAGNKNEAMTEMIRRASAPPWEDYDRDLIDSVGHNWDESPRTH